MKDWEEEQKETLEDWKPVREVNMDEKIATSRKWLEERKAIDPDYYSHEKE